jgi:threonine/homoserine/homoserine lactone efflux protein
MPALITVLLFALATLIQTATPGPGVLYLTARTAAQGRRAGFASMVGIESGEVVWLAAVATGLAALLEASVSALTLLRLAGAAYLIYLGIQRWRTAEAPPAAAPAALARVFVQGLVTQLLNPKVAVFFVAFLPQFINPDRPIAPQIAVLGPVYIAVAVMVDVTYVMTTSTISARWLSSLRARRRSGRFAAVTYVALGLAAAALGTEKALAAS